MLELMYVNIPESRIPAVLIRPGYGLCTPLIQRIYSHVILLPFNKTSHAASRLSSKCETHLAQLLFELYYSLNILYHEH